MTPDDFRIRNTMRGYTVWQRIGSGWELLTDEYATRAEARAAIEGFCTAGEALR